MKNRAAAVSFFPLLEGWINEDAPYVGWGRFSGNWQSRSTQQKIYYSLWIGAVDIHFNIKMLGIHQKP